MNKYLTILENAWNEHLKEKEQTAPTVISLFAGCGGSSLGYSMAGFKELLAVEWDNNAVETFKLNFPDVPIYHGDIANCSIDWILENTDLKVGELDVLDGSPPCQGFSTAGKRIIDDPRNKLFKEYVRILQGLQPKVFVMENVSGMVKGKMKLVFAEIIRELKSSGYKVSARLLNAMYFNVPQSRQRMIFIGVREDLGIEPSHPKAESKPFTVRDAIGHLENNFEENKPEFITLKQGQKIYNYGTSEKRIYSNKQLGTQCKSGGTNGGNLDIHYCKNRYLQIDEIQLLCSFHKDFKLTGRQRQKVDVLGNMVPPLFMRSIASHIRKYILT